MTQGAEYLRDNCKPGDVALIWEDIGIMARDGIGDCHLEDGGALATPQLRGMTLEGMLAHLKPTYLVQTIGHSRSELTADYPQFELEMSEGYTDPALAGSGELDYLNIYRVNNA